MNRQSVHLHTSRREKEVGFRPSLSASWAARHEKWQRKYCRSYSLKKHISVKTPEWYPLKLDQVQKIYTVRLAILLKPEQIVEPYSLGHCVWGQCSAALSSWMANVWIISAVIMQSTLARSQAKATSHSIDRHQSHCNMFINKTTHKNWNKYESTLDKWKI